MGLQTLELGRKVNPVIKASERLLLGGKIWLVQMFQEESGCFFGFK